MKNASAFMIAIFCLFSLSIAKSGPAIPRPKIDANHAILIADSALKSIPENKWIGFNVNEYILFQVIYSTDIDISKRDKNTEWFWLVKYVHPDHNDHSYVYKINSKGNIKLIKATE